jgi:hypothetical protein
MAAVALLSSSDREHPARVAASCAGTKAQIEASETGAHLIDGSRENRTSYGIEPPTLGTCIAALHAQR